MFGLIIIMAILIATLFMLVTQSLDAYAVCVRRNMALTNELNNFNNDGSMTNSVPSIAATD